MFALQIFYCMMLVIGRKSETRVSFLAASDISQCLTDLGVPANPSEWGRTTSRARQLVDGSMDHRIRMSHQVLPAVVRALTPALGSKILASGNDRPVGPLPTSRMDQLHPLLVPHILLSPYGHHRHSRADATIPSTRPSLIAPSVNLHHPRLGVLSRPSRGGL